MSTRSSKRVKRVHAATQKEAPAKSKAASVKQAKKEVLKEQKGQQDYGDKLDLSKYHEQFDQILAAVREEAHPLALKCFMEAVMHQAQEHLEALRETTAKRMAELEAEEGEAAEGVDVLDEDEARSEEEEEEEEEK
eukprot:g78269.t1